MPRVDERASQKAYNGILQIFSGAAGGTTGLFTMLVSEIIGAEREISARSDAFEVKLRHEDRVYELVIDRGGKVLESEKSLRPIEYPSEIVQAAHAAFPGGTLASVEVIQIGTETQYHVKKRSDGANYKIVLRRNAELIRVVREARAEIEIPLKDG